MPCLHYRITLMSRQTNREQSMRISQELKWKMKVLNAAIISIILLLTNKRFDKSWRREETKFKAFIYNHVLSTVKANHFADKLKQENDYTKAI